MTEIDKQSENIRLVVTAITIAEYGLIGINGKQDLKMRVGNAISSCRKVQDYFNKHPGASEQTRKTFKEQFLSDEIVLLTELLKSCFGINADGLETIINAIKNNVNEH
jgi:hypothetical protein